MTLEELERITRIARHLDAEGELEAVGGVDALLLLAMVTQAVGEKIPEFRLREVRPC